MARNHGDVWVPVELARALFAQALTDKARRTELLHEASTVLDSTSATIRNLHEVQKWHAKISAEQGAEHS
jgi:hypothetical protein